ncbi:MAG TPA: murein biosynthesis integral membrane protein MurJ [Candidatus Eisenbacteria bacterium]|nr:murein biosynthesis integral membrane protein MurJ [Candidatus Eisenbacteria bacterium]
MATNLLQKGISLLLRQQTNILSAAFIIMATVILSQLLGLVRQRFLVGIFGASNTLGVYLASSRLPDFLFQLIIAGALSSAFIPVFSDYLRKNKEKEGHAFASTILSLGLGVFFVLSLILVIFAEFFSHLLAPGFSSGQISLMANLMRIIIAGELLFIIGSFLSAVLQSYNHFFIPGIAAALYNLGIILGMVFLSQWIGIYAPAVGVIIGSLIFVGLQLPLIRKIGFTYHPKSLKNIEGFKEVINLMWPRTLSLAIFQSGTLLTVTLISFLADPGRSYVIFDYAQTLAFAPVALFGQTIAQAAFPVLSRQREDLEAFKATFITSLYQMLYLVLPISVLFLVLRIPIVRLIYGAAQFDWPATVLTGRVMGFFVISLFAQAVIYLISRAFYALHDTVTPLIVGALSTAAMLIAAGIMVFFLHFGITSIAIAYSFGSILQFVILFVVLHVKTKGFHKMRLFITLSKLFTATFFTGFALYIPIKLLDQLVFDTTHTVNLILLTGISSIIGLSLYVLLTWLFQVQEARTYLLILKKLGNWREILGRSDEVIDGANLKV